MERIEGYLTLLEVATFFGVDRRRVESWVRRGHLRAIKPSPKCYLVPIEALREFQIPKPGPRPASKQTA